MSNKLFATIIAAIVLGLGIFIFVKQMNVKPDPMIGTKHANQGQDHITTGQKHTDYNSSPASSGPHYNDASSPTPWGVYTQEVPAEVFIHNEEHGGIIIAYNPAVLPSEDLKSLQTLFAPPYRVKKFTPGKAIVTPQAKTTKAIELASWNYTLSLDKYDEATIMKFYNQHVGKAPEAGAGPSNSPINQATGN